MQKYSEVPRGLAYFESIVGQLTGLAPAEDPESSAVSWGLLQSDLAISTLGTIEPCRRRGFAHAVASALCHEVQEKHGLPAFAYIDDRNAASKATLGKLDLQPRHIAHWMWLPSANGSPPVLPFSTKGILASDYE
jgi:hypothetical protein